MALPLLPIALLATVGFLAVASSKKPANTSALQTALGEKGKDLTPAELAAIQKKLDELGTGAATNKAADVVGGIAEGGAATKGDIEYAHASSALLHPQIQGLVQGAMVAGSNPMHLRQLAHAIETNPQLIHPGAGAARNSAARAVGVGLRQRAHALETIASR